MSSVQRGNRSGWLTPRRCQSHKAHALCVYVNWHSLPTSLPKLKRRLNNAASLALWIDLKVKRHPRGRIEESDAAIEMEFGVTRLPTEF